MQTSLVFFIAFFLFPSQSFAESFKPYKDYKSCNRLVSANVSYESRIAFEEACYKICDFARVVKASCDKPNFSLEDTVKIESKLKRLKEKIIYMHNLSSQMEYTAANEEAKKDFDRRLKGIGYHVFKENMKLDCNDKTVKKSILDESNENNVYRMCVETWQDELTREES